MLKHITINIFFSSFKKEVEGKTIIFRVVVETSITRQPTKRTRKQWTQDFYSVSPITWHVQDT